MSGADDALDVDVVVIGGGMAGLTVAASVAQAQRSVIVLEAADDVGGSARLSEGYVWTAPSLDVFEEEDPGGDAELFVRLLDALEPSFAWVEELSVPLGPRLTKVLGYGEGRQIDVGAYIARCVSIVESAGGYVLRGTAPSSLATHDGRVTGVVVPDGEGGEQTLGARAVVVATGGFQSSEEARAEWMGESARDLLLRSNQRSVGDGIRLGLDVGADLKGPADGFYGHLVAYPVDRFEPRDFAALSQYYSEHGVLVDRRGLRFTDESLGDHVNTIAVVATGRAVLIVDERVRRSEVVRAFIPGMDAVDKLELAAGRGARTSSAPSLDELATSLDAWGYDGTRAVATVREFNAALQTGSALSPSRARLRSPLIEPPFAAIEVQPAITFTYRGLASDADGRVLSGGEPIPGLYVAGADLGGLNARGYTGGLVRGLALGRVTAAALAADLGWS